MAKFIVLSFLAVLAVYAQGISIPQCAQLAILKGVPELGIPPHNPLVLQRNNTFHLDNLYSKNFTFELSKITWTNIPFFKLIENSVTKNTTDVLGVDGAITWNNFTIGAKYAFSWGELELNGYAAVIFKDITWNASWEETKPNSEGVKKINSLRLSQTIGSRSIVTTGFGEYSAIADNLLLVLADTVTEVHFRNNVVGRSLVGVINKYWYGKPDYYNKFLTYCNSQNVTSELY